MENLLESLFYVLWRGIAIGVIISAPMGPVGMLCIQRTLSKGRLTGLYTGIGAAISDIFYSMLTGFGLSFVEDFLTRNHDVIQLLGSGVLIGFAFYLLRKNPTSAIKGTVNSDEGTPLRDIGGGFLFTFSNPMIIFLIIGLFARFNFLDAGLSWYVYILGYIGIAAGALGWWWLVTFFIDKVRSHFNVRSMWLINRIIGSVILIFGIVGIVTGSMALAKADTVPLRPGVTCWNSARGFSPWSADTTATRLRIGGRGLPPAAQLTLPEGHETFTISWRLSVPDERPRRQGSAPLWQLRVGDGPGACRITAMAEDPDRREGLGRNPYMVAKVWREGDPKPLAGAVMPDADIHGDVNHFRLTRNGDDWSFSVTNRRHTMPLKFRCAEPAGCLAFHADTEVVIDEINLDLKAARPANLSQRLDSLAAGSSADPVSLEGVWRVLDRTLDESLLRLGGDYRLAMVDLDGGRTYSLVYLDGAKINATAWTRGMEKGRISQGAFENIFSLEWCDSQGAVMSHDLSASLDPETMTLTLLFPYQDSTVRLRKTSEKP